MRLLSLLLICCSMVPAAPVTGLPSFLQDLGFVQTNLAPQTAPVLGPAAGANVVFGYNELDTSTNLVNVGSSSAQQSATWDQFAGAFASSSVQNGELSVYTSVYAPSIPAGYMGVQAHAFAAMLDVLNIQYLGAAPGSVGYLLLSVRTTGTFSCDSSLVSSCPSGVVLGYWTGTLGLNQPVHSISGGDPTPLLLNLDTTTDLVPLPFVVGEDFNVSLVLGTTARVLSWAGNTYAVADLGHTLRISGASVLDALGNPVSNPVITSALGINYPAATAVPEPSTGLLIAAPLAVLLYRLRRR